MPMQRLETLDAMRGVAAIGVVAYHAGSMLSTPSMLTVHGNIAVDFFFALSGFVLAMAFERRLAYNTVSAKSFVAGRIVRLWPMIIFGTGLSVILMTLSGDGFGALGDMPGLTIALAFFGAPGPDAGWINFAVNAVYWSLIGEFAVNLIYVCIFKIRTSLLIMVNVLMFAILAYYVDKYNEIQILPEDPETLFVTSVRVFFSFFMGVITFRLREKFGMLRNVHPIIPIAIFVVPLIMPGSFWVVRVMLPLVYVSVGFPLVIWLAADAKIAFSGLFKFLGDASYPLYAIHLPVLLICVPLFKEQHLLVRFAFCAVFPLAMAAIAFGIAHYYDVPFRKRLSRILLRR